MPLNNKKLDSVSLNDRWFRVGVDGVSAIEMRTDGNGISGHYDVIYVRFTTGEIIAMPAHNVEDWSYIETPATPDEEE